MVVPRLLACQGLSFVGGKLGARYNKAQALLRTWTCDTARHNTEAVVPHLPDLNSTISSVSSSPLVAHIPSSSPFSFHSVIFVFPLSICYTFIPIALLKGYLPLSAAA